MHKFSKKFLIILPVFTVIYLLSTCRGELRQPLVSTDTILFSDTIQYHPVRISKSDGSILPWFSADKGESYDTVILLVWNFWKNMETDSNGLKYYMNHQVWAPWHDMRGLGGDQLNMALSSWALLYAYTGDREILENMRYIADNYLERSLSGPDARWPHIPYPYNTEIHSGIYDGDMINGKDFTQPDKAGTFGYELINLYKITGDVKYLESAKRIAGTLIKNLTKGDSIRSPLPFRVNAKTGEIAALLERIRAGRKVGEAVYTTNWTGTMMLFEELIKIDPEKAGIYSGAFNTFLEWMKNYPLKTNRWGPFFEDVPGWSDTQINAMTFATFIMNHRELFPSWKEDVKGIIEWTYRELGNHDYEKYGVTVMNEQTAYRVPGNSHSSRQASVELLYSALTGDTSYVRNAIRTLNWATYTVASDGRNRYIRDDIWLTDGYGDYIRHYLRAMASMPELAPASKNRFLKTSSVVTSINYSPESISYSTYGEAEDMLRLIKKPCLIKCDGVKLREKSDGTAGNFSWEPLNTGGVLTISHAGKNVEIEF